MTIISAMTTNTVTVVSCFYIIKSKFSKEKYIEWIKNFLSIGFNALIFCDSGSLDFIKSHIPNVTTATNITFKILNIEDFVTSTRDWSHEPSLDDEIKKGTNHSIELYKIWNEKIFFLDKATQLNPYGAQYFLWIDIGSFRNKTRLNEIKELNFPTPHNFENNKMTMFRINNFTKKERINVNIIDSRFKKCNRYGGMFGGDSVAIHTFKKKYESLLNQFKKKKVFAGKDQSIYNFLVLQNPELIQTVDANTINEHYDKWFCFHYYFSDYCNHSKVTVLIPLFNGIEFIEQCIDCLNKQTYRNFEIIIGVNGHKAESKVCLAAKKYEQNGYITVKDYGIFADVTNKKSATLNEMIKDVKTDWVALLDIDDLWLPTKLEKQMTVVKQHKYDIVGTKCQYFGESDRVPPIHVGEITQQHLKKTNHIINSSALLKKSLCQWSVDEICEDYDMWIRLSKRGFKIYNIDEILVKHQIRKDSFFNTKNGSSVQGLLSKHFENPRILTITLRGGLGNQLFEIGTVLTQAQRLDMKPMFLKVKKVNKRPVYWDKYVHDLNFIKPEKFKNITNVRKDGVSGTLNKIKLNIDNTKNIKLKGFYQNYNIISKNIVTKHFKLNDEEHKTFMNRYTKLINSTTVGLHIRRTDFLSNDYYVPLQLKNYYKKALKIRLNEIGDTGDTGDVDTTVVVFSDDSEWCKKNVTHGILDINGEINIVYISDKDYYELHLMRHMKDLIISNSTFSWWGAFLNHNEDAKIICPKKWFTRGDLEIGLLPPNWVQI